MIRLLVLLAVLGIILMLAAGCAKEPPPPIELEKPSPRLMLDIPDLPPVRVGDNLYLGYGVCRAEYGRVATTARGLQNYVRVITKRKEQTP